MKRMLSLVLFLRDIEIWVGVEPNGISILDRLENKIVYLDYRLNYMSEVNLEPRLYPDLAAIDKWGKMFRCYSLYSCF